MKDQKNAAWQTAAHEKVIANGKFSTFSVSSDLAKEMLEDVKATSDKTKSLFRIQSANGFINESKHLFIRRKKHTMFFKYV